MMIAGALFLGLASNAQARQYIDHYYDTIRPHGHKRSDAIDDANDRYCDHKVGVQSFDAPDSTAYRQCMSSRGYRHLYTSVVRARHAATPPAEDSPQPDSAPIDNSSPPNSDDFWRTEQMINTQQMINDQQSSSDQQTQSQQQLMNSQ
jgi:hypothetical protein